MPRPSLESADDLAAFFDLADFAIRADWTHGATTVQVSALFDEEAMDYDPEVGAVVSAARPRMFVRDSELPSGAAQGDALSIDGRSFLVRDLRPDGSGVVTVDLEAV